MVYLYVYVCVRACQPEAFMEYLLKEAWTLFIP